MSGEKTASPCNKFQANIFNKSKCQNCFKSRELHLLSDHDMNQAKPIYGGWLCLAPEGTNFDNPMQRSRKWQRRFFILYEHGSLSFALDELPSTLPQGTVNMNLCTEVVDAEPRTGQRNALLLVTPEQEFFIRGENKEIINGWSEQLTVYPQTNQQNQKKKKRRVEAASFQEPSPAKMAATESGSPPALRGAAESGSGLRQEELPGGVTEADRVWTVTGTGPLNPHETPADNVSQYLPSAPRERSSFNGSLLSCSSCISSSLSSLDSEASGSSDSGSDQQPAPNNSHTIKQRAADRGCYKDTGTPNMVHSGRTEAEKKVEQVWSRTGRAEGRSSQREKLQSCGDIAQLTVPPSQRRSKSLDRRTTESIMTPDLLNFKKGWMVKLDKKDEWTKYWFVLSADSLRYYKDSIAEEASDLQGDIDLTKCYSVSEYQVQRNYGFQIHTQKGVYTLTAMTAGIRKNWIQALMKNVRPSNAPDVTSLPGHIISCSPTEALPKPDVTHDSSTETPSVTDQGPKPSRVREKRHQGRYKTFDWTEFRPLAKPVPELNVQSAKDPFPLDVERKTRREERRKRYEGILGFPLGLEDVGDKGSSRRSPGTKRRVKGEIEQCWLQVENTLFTLDRSVPLCTEAQVKQTVELERLLENYRKGVEDLKGQLAESDHQRLELEAQLNAAQDPQQQVLTGTLPLLIDPPLAPESDEGPPKTIPVLSHTQSLRELYRETQELLQQQDTIRQSMQEQLGLSVRQMLPYHQTQPPSIWLLDTEGNLQELEDLFPGGPVPRNTPALSPVSDSPPLPSDLADEPVLTSKMERGVQQLARSPESHTDPSVWCPDSLITEDTVERNSILGTDSQACWEADRPRPEHVDPDHIPVRTLSDEMVRLTGQNEALERLNQEMLNQLKEADREIDRLKAELLSRHREVNVQPEAACLERELGMRTQELGETQALLASLDQRLMDTEAQLQLKEATLKVLGFPELEAIHKESVYLSHFEVKGEGLQPKCFEDTGAKLWEPERRLRQSEEASTQTEAEMDVDILNKEMNSGRSVEGKDMLCGDNSTSSDDRIQEVVKGIAIRSKVMGKAQEVISRSALKVINSPFQRELEEGKPRVVRHLLWEEEFWGAMWISWKTSPSQVDKDGPLGSILGDVLKHMVMETQMLLLAHSFHSEKAQNTETGRGSQEMLCGSRSLKDLDIIGNIEGETESEMIEGNVEIEEKEYVHLNACQRNTDTVTDRRFTEVTQEKLSLLNQVASHVSTSATDELCSMANRLCDFHSTRHPWLSLVHCAAIQVFSYYQIHLLLDQQQRALDSEPVPHSPSIVCSNCAGLLSENQELRKRLSDLEKSWHSSAGSPMVEQPDIQASKRQDPELKRTAETDIQASELKQAAETDIQGPELKQAAETDIQGPELKQAAETDIQDPELKQAAETDIQASELKQAAETDIQAPELKQAAETDIQDPELKQAAETDIQDSESHGPELKQAAETAGVSDGGTKQDRGTKEEEVRAGTPEELVVEGDSSSMEIPPLNNTQKIQEKKTCEIIEGRNIVFPDNETEISGKEEVLLLRRRVKDLEEQLSMSTEQLAAEHDGRMASLQLQHEKDIGKLKATYECGFVSMEESHQKVLLELHHRHQQHLQRLLRDRDRLLEEEVAATATAIQAIQNAHCLELKKEVQKIRQTSTGNTDLEEICRQHSEELASCQRELEVLSQQFSLKYLENGHLAQALEAERQALCQCQQENQDLRSRNQELTGHLAAEITRLCSLAKQDTTPHNQGMDGYELEITLRVKESELQCLKQEITSIKDELQTAQRDKRFATQKYKDIYTELSILRAKAERDSNQLRENLNLAHKALGKNSPRNTNNGIIV